MSHKGSHKNKEKEDLTDRIAQRTAAVHSLLRTRESWLTNWRIRMGRELSALHRDIRKKYKHGHWEKYLAKHFPGLDLSTARRYVRLSKKADSKTGNLPDFPTSQDDKDRKHSEEVDKIKAAVGIKLPLPLRLANEDHKAAIIALVRSLNWRIAHDKILTLVLQLAEELKEANKNENPVVAMRLPEGSNAPNRPAP